MNRPYSCARLATRFSLEHGVAPRPAARQAAPPGSALRPGQLRLLVTGADAAGNRSANASPGCAYGAANGQLALGAYKLDEESNRYRPIALEVLTLRGELIAEVTSFRDPELVRRFGLPAEVSPE